MGEEWKTSVKSCEPKHSDSEHPECIGEQIKKIKDKCEIGPKHSRHPACTGRRAETSGMRNPGPGFDNWETSAKSCGQRIQSVEGDS